MKKVLMYGTGRVTEFFLNYCAADKQVVGFLKTNKEKDSWKDRPVYSVEEISMVSYDEIWLTNAHVETLENCLNNGIKKERLVICNEVLCDEYCRNHLLDIKYMKKEAEEYEEYCRSRWSLLLTTTMDFPQTVYYTKSCDILGGCLINEDYYRYAMFKLLALEIKRRGIKGSIAELGVYQGAFAACLNEEFPDRRLYLFDTFEGAPQQDVIKDVQNGYNTEMFLEENNYADTSVEYVMKRMIFPKMCDVRKGYFPDTIPEEEERYAFVAMGCGLFEPTLAGLKYFYPRLAEGGYIMMDDYNRDERWGGLGRL